MTETALQAQIRAVTPLLQQIRDDARDLRTADQLVHGVAVKVCGDWYGFDGLDTQGRMVLWAAGHRDPFVYGPTNGETFLYRELIG